MMLSVPFDVSGQTLQPWLDKKCAVVLTYDDAIHQHLDNALPVLDSLNLKATFYLTAFSDAAKNRMDEWRSAAAHGHELANHTLFHPCIGGEGRSWVPPDRDLRNYTVTRMIQEVLMTNVWLKALDGKSRRTFAYTCGDMKIGDSSFIITLKNDLVAARAVRNEMHTINEIDLYNTDCYLVNHTSFEEMKGWVDQAIRTKSLLVFLFHGVGGGNSLDINVKDHRRILEYIKQNEKDILIAPMIEVADHIREWQALHKVNKK